MVVNCCSSSAALNYLFLVLFLLHAAFICIGGIGLIAIEGECDPHHVHHHHSEEISQHMVPFLNFCNELSKIRKPYIFDGLSSDDNKNSTSELTQTLSSLCSNYTKKVRADEKKCSKWTSGNIIRYFSYASATAFTIGSSYVAVKSTAGIVFVMVYALFGMPIALSMLAVGSKIMVFYVWEMIKWFEKRCLGHQKVNHSHIKIMIVVVLLFFTCIVVASTLTTGNGLDDMSWFVAIHYWFENMTTIGEVPVHFGVNDGWKRFLLIPYNLILLLGLITTASLLNLSLKIIAICEWHNMVCCYTTCKKQREPYEKDSDMEGVLSEISYYYDSEASTGGNKGEKELEMLMANKE